MSRFVLFTSFVLGMTILIATRAASTHEWETWK
jgi:hypothetical protein